MSPLHRTGALVRLVLRRDRIRLLVWVGGILVVLLASAASMPDLYPDDAAIAAYVEISRNPAVVVFTGPGYGFDDPSIGTVLVNELELFGGIALALMSMFLIVRHTRAEEDSERVELLRSSAVGRHAPTAAAVVVVGCADLVIGIGAALGFVAMGYGAAGAITLAGSLTAVGLVFVGVATVAAEVAGNARSALAIAGVALGAAFVLRAVGDVGDSGWRWLSPIGWAQASRAFAGERWWPLALAAIVAAGLVVDGGIYRHDFVAATVVQALMQVQLETDTPVFSVVLTPHHFHEHQTHRRFFHDHFRIKGAEAAQACAQTLASLGRLQAA